MLLIFRVHSTYQLSRMYQELISRSLDLTSSLSVSGNRPGEGLSYSTRKCQNWFLHVPCPQSVDTVGTLWLLLACCDLNETCLPWLRYLNTWLTLGSSVWGRFQRTALQEKVYHQGRVWEFNLSAPGLGLRCERSAFCSPYHASYLLPCFSAMMDSYNSGMASQDNPFVP